MEIIKYIQFKKDVLINLFDGLRQDNYYSYKLIYDIMMIIKNIDIDKN